MATYICKIMTKSNNPQKEVQQIDSAYNETKIILPEKTS